MNLRKRLFLSLVVTLFILGSAILVWGESTGRWSIFADQTTVVNTDLAVNSQIDLVKGVSAGDQMLTTINNGIELLPNMRSGNAVFSIGQNNVLKFYRVVPIIPTTLGSHSSVSMQFAGSIDGVAYSDYSPVQPVSFDPTSGQAEPINLEFLIPDPTRFLKIKVILERTDATESPVFGGFTANYDLPSPTTDTTDSQQILVNDSPANTDASTPAQIPGTPSSLVVTGPGWWPLALATLWLICITLIIQAKPRSAEGAHDSRTAPRS